MLQGIALSMQGMAMMQHKQDQIANNLANAITDGYKSSQFYQRSFSKYLADDKRNPYVNSEIHPDEVVVDYAQGPAKETGGSLDTMIEGDGFFSVLTAEGVRYTRCGTFSISKDGFLVTNDGSKVLGKEGFIKIDPKQPVSFLQNGEVVQGTETRGYLRIADFNRPYRMTRTGNGCFSPLQPDNPEKEGTSFKIRQGFIEASNVNIVKNMVSMITAYRTYESCQKAIHSQDQTLDRAVNSVGRLNG